MAILLLPVSRYSIQRKHIIFLIGVLSALFAFVWLLAIPEISHGFRWSLFLRATTVWSNCIGFLYLHVTETFAKNTLNVKVAVLRRNQREEAALFQMSAVGFVLNSCTLERDEGRQRNPKKMGARTLRLGGDRPHKHNFICLTLSGHYQPSEDDN